MEQCLLSEVGYVFLKSDDLQVAQLEELKFGIELVNGIFCVFMMLKHSQYREFYYSRVRF